MEELIIYSPKGIPNVEKYLNTELAKAKRRNIFSIDMKESGDIQLMLENNSVTAKYFARTVKKTERVSQDVNNFLDKNKEAIKLSTLIKTLEYSNFFVLFFRKS